MWSNQDVDVYYGVRDYKTWAYRCLGFTCVG